MEKRLFLFTFIFLIYSTIKIKCTLDVDTYGIINPKYYKKKKIILILIFIKICSVSEFDGKNGNLICNGNFGNINYFNQLSVLLSNDEITPPINTTKLFFPLISVYNSDNIIFQMFGTHNKPFKLNISPIIENNRCILR
ncbi:hypothetical protein ACTA71_003973 [Dictyostelium dimigraforme]